ncbi:hypothetical protein TRICI_004830 [Trichomonascus ciferrii]|uniref:Chitinase n=1 Tax=Trichomonascus ciferrii TaxID=44093 RepID=A0A642UYW9_9ASCO|nr:hypothetical protein TRICI_004830 [Trichomonascus ciferrii]
MKYLRAAFLSILLFCQCVFSHNPACRNNIVYYYGQGKGKNKSHSLHGYCSEDYGDVFIISSLTASKRGEPELNLKGVDDAVSYPHSELKHYPSLENDIKHCQILGKKILLSIEDDISIHGDAEYLARLVWQLFGPNTTADNRPFGTAVIDGFDLSTKHYNCNQRNLPTKSSESVLFAQTLRSQIDLAGQGHEYLLSASLPCQFLKTQMPAIRNLQSTFFDMALVKDYSQTCQFTLDQWDEFLQTGLNSKIALYLGLSFANSKVTPDFIIERLQSNDHIDTLSGIALSDASTTFSKTLRNTLGTSCNNNS